MKKRILSILLAFVMVVGLLPTTVLAAAEDNAIKLELVKDTTTFSGKEVLRMDFYAKSGTDTPDNHMVYLKYDASKLAPLSVEDGSDVSEYCTNFSENNSSALAANPYSVKIGMGTKTSEVMLYTIIQDGHGYICWKVTEPSGSPAFADFTRISSIFFGLKSGITFDTIPSNVIGYSDPKVDGSITAGSSAAEITVNGGGDGNVYKYKNKDAVTDTMTVAPVVAAGDGVTLVEPPKPALQGSVSISGTVQIGQTLTATPNITSSDPGALTYKWYRGDSTTPISGAAGNTYTPDSAEDVGKTIKVEVSAANYSGSLSGTTAAAVIKAAGPAAPGAPTEQSHTHDTITVNKVTGQEYACIKGSGSPSESDWTDQVVFSGLTPNTAYNIYTRIAATAIQEASAASSALSVTTGKAPAGTPVTPQVTNTTDTSITVKAESGQKYCIKPYGEAAPAAGDSSWSDTVSFTGLTPNTKYVIYTYIPEGSDTVASVVVSTEATTHKTAITDTLVPVSGLTGKTYTAEAQEPTFGGSLTRDTDYTVSYALKNVGEGELKDGKPCGAGTYVVTVEGKGDYGSSFTKDFVIGRKEVTITPDSDQSKTYGDSDPALTYATGLTGALETAFNAAKTGALARAAGEDVGNYAINLGTLAAGDNFQLTLAGSVVNFSITAKNVTADRGAEDQNVVKGVGDFTEPTFGEITGTLKYTYDSVEYTTYNSLKNVLKELSTDATGTISYTYTASGNYSGAITGSIDFTVVDVTFEIDPSAITVATDPTYGDKWSDIVSFDPSKITAKVGDYTCGSPEFTLQNADEYPNQGSQTYTIKFSGTINGVNYTDVTVTSDSVSIAKATVTVTAGSYKVSKVYDGGTTAGTATGELDVSGILPKDTGVTVIPTVSAYSDGNVGGQSEVDVSLALSGTGSDNYQLASSTVSVPCEITRATLTVEGTASAAADYGTALKDISITGLTVKLNGAVVDGTWAFSGETILDADNSSDYTATFTPAAGAGNYEPLTRGITPTINKVDYTGSAITANKNVLTNTAVNGVEVDMAALISGIKGAAVSAASEKSDTDNIISNISTDGNKVKFDVASIAGKDKTATINVTIASTNYNPITAVITVTTVDKDDAGVSISGAPATKTYGDADFTLTASVTDAGTGTGTWTWESSDPTVLAVTGSGATAAVKVLKAGSAAITAKFESDTTMGEQTTAAITVSKRVITVTADNKSMTVNGTLPTFTVSYGNLPSGVQAEDIFATLPTASTTADGKTTGSFDIAVTTPVLTTEAAVNYEVGAVTKGTLTVNSASSGGGGGGGVATYAITVEPAANGAVTSSHKSASKGDTVTLTVAPDKGCALETLTVTDSSSNKIALTEKDGKYTFTMPASKVTVKAVFAEIAVEPENPFADVAEDSYYYDAVLWAVGEKITSGTSDTAFSPDAACTRAQAVTFLWRAAGSPAPKSGTMPFTDVAADAYYHDAVLWAVEQGITAGTSATTFSPDATCTRAQIVTFLWRSQEAPAAGSVNPFTDVAADAYYNSAVLWAVENGITAGTTANTFSPDNDCTRAQIVTFLFRCLGK